MIAKTQDGKMVQLTVCGKYEDDIQVNDIWYVDCADQVPEADIEYVTKTYYAQMFNEWYEDQVDAAENISDFMNDR